MSADFRFVLDAAEAHADEFTIQRTRDGTRDARLSHTRRPNETENGRFHVPRQFEHREIFGNALLDLFKAVMIGIQHFHAVGKFLRVLRLLSPRQIENPVEIPRNHRVFGRGGLHFIQPVQLFEALLLHLFGQLLRKNFLAVFVLFLAVVPELRMNGFELLAQKIILLRTVDVLADGGSNFLFDLCDFQLVVETALEQFEPFDDRFFFQKLLLDFQAHAHGGNGHIDISIGVGAGFQLREDILADFPVRHEHVAHHFARGAEIGLLQYLVAVFGQNFIRHRIIISRLKLNGAGAGAVQSLGENPKRSPGELRHLLDARHRTDGIDVVRRDFVLFRLALRADKEQSVRRSGRPVDRL